MSGEWVSASTWAAIFPSSPGFFSTSALVTFWDQTIPSCGELSCVLQKVSCIAGFYPLGASNTPTPSPWLVTTENVSRHCQTSPGLSDHPQMRTIDLTFWTYTLEKLTTRAIILTDSRAQCEIQGPLLKTQYLCWFTYSCEAKSHYLYKSLPQELNRGEWLITYTWGHGSPLLRFQLHLWIITGSTSQHIWGYIYLLLYVTCSEQCLANGEP